MKGKEEHLPAQAMPQIFVVRVYRRSTHLVIGQVEDVRSRRVQPFRTARELWQILAGSRPRGSKRMRT